MLPAREPSGRPRKVALQITICKTCNQISKIFHRLLKSKTMPESSSMQGSADDAQLRKENLTSNRYQHRSTRSRSLANTCSLGLVAPCCIDLKFKLKRNRQTCLVTPALLCPRHFSTLTHAQCQCSRDVRLSIMMTVVRPCSVRDAAGQSQHCSVAWRVRGGGGPESAS